MRSKTALGKLLALTGAAAGLALAFAPFPFRFLAFGALVPLFWLIDLPGTKRKFLWAWLFGGLAAGFHLWWIWFLIIPVETVTRILLNIGVTALFAYLGVYVGVFALAVRRLGLWFAPLVWVVLEFARGQLQIAFPWTFIGYSMTPWTPFIQPAALGGVYLVSGWVVLVNLLVYKLLFPWRQGLRSRAAYGIALAVAFGLPLGYHFATVGPLERWFRVSIVQPNVSPFDKGDFDSREQIRADLLRLTRRAAVSGPELIVYPETATLVDVTRPSNMSRDVRRLVDSLGIEVATGTPLRHGKRERVTWHNGAVVLKPGEDSVTQRHYKMRLVPFSEKIPYSDEVPLLRKMIGTADMGNWDRGWAYNVLDWAKGKLSFLVCYEAIFPDLTREFVRRGSDLLVVVTNDGWFGRLPGIHQHAELAVMRTVETGVPMVRSANNGISFIVDPFGRVLGKTRLFEQTVLEGDVPGPRKPTPYVRWGDWFVVLSCVGIVAGFALRSVQRLGRKRKAA
ncbi:MAG: apolipoprotein N-acyltransferase [candidate division WOR-3 bacterium]|nr:MAG: apolipoprotein N-acyltransferase [candidate division WOR-3 bacterium]